MTSLIRTSAVTACANSLTLPSMPVWEWQSMTPGETCLPRPSIASAPARS